MVGRSYSNTRWDVAVQHEKSTELRRFFAALSDETRLKIAAAIVDRSRAVGELATDLSVKDGVVAKHLSILVDAGLAVVETEDGAMRYRLDVDWLRSRRKFLLARDTEPLPTGAPGMPDADRVILSRFVDGERLMEIPTDNRKRLIVLAWLASQFDEGREYPEREVNEIIKRHHPDASALRRYLIDCRMMQRENGVYWRVPSES